VGAKGTLHARRQLISKIGNGMATEKLLTSLKERYAERSGGYTRVLKAGFRQGDNAAMALIELVDRDMSAKGNTETAPKAEEKEVEAAEKK